MAVAEELHFGRAAERVHIAQPPLSQQILLLESEIGVKLLERTKRRVRLTHAGKVFLEEARRILDLSDQAVQAAQRADRGEIGRLVVAFVASGTLHICSVCASGLQGTIPRRAAYPQGNDHGSAVGRVA